MTSATSIVWPIVFTHRGTILGNGFLANIELRGRLLAMPELEGVWLYGVTPGALSLGATTLNDASAELRDMLTRLFIDFAHEAPDFDGFKATVEKFFAESDAETEADWNAAVASVRAGRVPVPDGLPRQDADGETFINVTLKPVEQLTTMDNPLVQQEARPALAAAA